MSTNKLRKKAHFTRPGTEATLQGSVLIIVKSPLTISVLSHEDVIALPVDHLGLQEVVQYHGSCVVGNVSNLLLLLSLLVLQFIKSSHFCSNHVLLGELRLLVNNNLGLGPSALRARLEHVDS